MQLIFDFARWIHIISGFLALFVFWIPIVTRKGGPVHNLVGWIYVAAMSAVSVTAMYMGLYRIVLDTALPAEEIPYSWFLIFVSILSGATAWYGVNVLKHKKRSAVHRRALDLLFPALLLGSGIAISAYGWVISFPLLQYFPMVGIFLGAAQLIYWLTVPKTKSHWLVEHLVGMLSCCISTVTAFAVFGAPRLLGIETVSVLLWFLPTIMLVPLIIGFSIYYKRKMDRKRG